MSALIIIYTQCLNIETYEQALQKCSKLNMSERNICRMRVTERYKYVTPAPIKEEIFFIKRSNNVNLIDFRERIKEVENND